MPYELPKYMPGTPYELKHALDTTHAFLSWYGEWLKEQQPYAKRTISRIEDFVFELPVTVDDLAMTPEEMDEDLARLRRKRAGATGRNE